jgi:hypothetical protein
MKTAELLRTVREELAKLPEPWPNNIVYDTFTSMVEKQGYNYLEKDRAFDHLYRATEAIPCEVSSETDFFGSEMKPYFHLIGEPNLIPRQVRLDWFGYAARLADQDDKREITLTVEVVMTIPRAMLDRTYVGDPEPDDVLGPEYRATCKANADRQWAFLCGRPVLDVELEEEPWLADTTLRIFHEALLGKNNHGSDLASKVDYTITKREGGK